MFTKKSSALFLALILAATPIAAMAQSANAPVDTSPAGSNGKVKWDQMTLQQKQQVVAEHEAKRKAMTPEQRAAAKQRHEERFKAMTPEQQAKVKAREAERKEIAKSMKNGSGTVSPAPAATPAQ